MEYLKFVDKDAIATFLKKNFQAPLGLEVDKSDICVIFEKYNNNDDSSSYKYSLGLNGLGACATQYSSEYMQVRSYKGNKLYSIDFKKGEPSSELQISDLSKKDKRTGTMKKTKNIFDRP